MLFPALVTLVAGIGVSLGVLIALAIAEATGTHSDAAWRKHHEECQRLPEELYHRDRFRAIRGRVIDAEGKPVPKALVRCVKLESLVNLAKAGLPTSAKWIVPIEAETTTNDEGAYDFPHLPVGARTFFFSAPGRELAPAIKDLIVVQDGLGAQLEVTLGRPAALRVRLETPAKAAMRVHLVPQRWWPTLMTAVVPQGGTSVEFSGLGGPFHKGLIAVSEPKDSSRLRVAGRYDLDRSAEVIISGAEEVASLLDLPEAAGLETWRVPMRASHRLFYAAMSPVALFWPVVGDDQPLWATQPAHPLPPPLAKVCQVGRGDYSRIRAAPVPAGAGRIPNGRLLAGVDQRSLGV